MVRIMDGMSGTAGVPPPPVIARIRAFALSPNTNNWSLSPAAKDKKYSAVKQDSTAALNRILVLLSGTDTPFTTGKISR